MASINIVANAALFGIQKLLKQVKFVFSKNELNFLTGVFRYISVAITLGLGAVFEWSRAVGSDSMDAFFQALVHDFWPTIRIIFTDGTDWGQYIAAGIVYILVPFLYTNIGNIYGFLKATVQWVGKNIRKILPIILSGQLP